MKYATTLPLTALIALGSITLLVNFGVIPPGMQVLEGLQAMFDQFAYLMIFLIILLESIIYVGFYFPGQFFAVVLVVLAEPDLLDIVWLTLAMVLAATLGSLINYRMGQATIKNEIASASNYSVRHLLLAMIHINSLAFFMFNQGANQRSIKVVLLAGVLNLPYYLLLIGGTAYLSEEVMQLAENTGLLFTLISIWLLLALIWDWRQRKSTATV